MEPINETAGKVLSTATREHSMTATELSTKTICEISKFLQFETLADPQLERMALACAEWKSALDEMRAPRWITFLGSSGCGKTHCARALWYYAKNLFDWMECRYVHMPIYWPKFIQELRAGDSYERRTDMHQWPVLFLDDIGAERDTSGYATEELNTLLGARIGKWTILTANLTINQFAGVDERMASRIIRDNNIVAQVKCQDYALRPKPKKPTADKTTAPAAALTVPVEELVAKMRQAVQ